MTQKEKQIAHIVSTTLTLIAEHGAAAVSISAIAERAGVSRQTVYNHFPDVAAVVETALEMHGEAMASELRARAAEAGTGPEKLAAIARFAIEASAGHASLSLEAVLPAETRARVARFNDLPRRVLDEVIADTHPGTRPDPVLADLTWAVIEAGAGTAGGHPDDTDRIATATIAALTALAASH